VIDFQNDVPSIGQHFNQAACARASCGVFFLSHTKLCFPLKKGRSDVFFFLRRYSFHLLGRKWHICIAQPHARRKVGQQQSSIVLKLIMSLTSTLFQPHPNFFLIAGPCAIEGEDMAYRIAEQVNAMCQRLHIRYVFKGSYRKANRSRRDSFTGIGDEKALRILRGVGERFGIPVTTDIHSDQEAAMAAEYVDVLQIPAFLCRQTSLLVAAAQTGKVVNIKKGQFVSPDAMQFAAEKVREEGNPLVMLTERGTTFGYQDLIVDYRGIPMMQSFGAPAVLDCTHSLQQPNQSSGVTGGRPALIETIARAGVAVGVDGLFIETHPDPSQAKSDGANMLPLERLEGLLERLVAIRAAIQ
jgi:2-dehydro-3-deoxyphosphooctonate aldolase (KDO 8-P synthase)